jgi:hypothetical protein
MEAAKARAMKFAEDGALPDATKWASMEWLAFLRNMPKDTKREYLEALDKKFGLTTTKNMMIAMRWFPIAIAADMQQAAPQIESFLVVVGRRWLVTEVYRALIAKGGFWRDLALKSFDRAKANYHTLTRDTVAKMLAEKKT